MSQFLFAAAALTLAALTCVLAPLLRPVASAPARQWRTAIVLGLALPLLAAGLYLVRGSPEALDPAQLAQEEVTPAQILRMVDGLSAKLGDSSKDAQGWAMLARSYATLGRYDEAVRAYGHLVQITPRDADALADYADTLAMTQKRSLLGAPEALVARALEADPNHVKALALAGSIAFEKHDYVRAAALWQRILPELPADSDLARWAQRSIAEAQTLSGQAASAPKQAPAAAARLSGRVELAPALRAQVAPEDTVFVFARAAQGARLPLAVLRKQVKDLPFDFVLDDSSGMGGARLSDAGDVVVGARVSKSGDALPQPGDLEGASGTVQATSSGIAVQIDSVRR